MVSQNFNTINTINTEMTNSNTHTLSDQNVVDKRVRMAETRFNQIGKSFYSHQLDGIKWMMGVEQRGSGGLLCDDPGLGKTYQALSLVVSSDTKTCTLIVVPASIIEQWRLAAVELLGKNAVYVHHGPKRLKQIPIKRVVITTYNLMISDKQIQKYYWYRAILDEIHKIKNSQSQSSKMAKALHVNYRWGLTGTPVQNNTAEIINIFRFITRKRFDVNDNNVYEYIRSHLIRRRKEVVLKDKIPELEVEVSEISFQTDKERTFYQKVQNNARREFTELMELGGNARDENVVMFELLLRLRQASQHPQLVLNGFTRKFMKGSGKRMRPYEDNSSKHIALINMLKLDRNEPALVFCHFREEIDILLKLVTTEGFTCARFDGSTGAAERAELINNLTRPEFTPSEVLILQITAGGIGLNLQRYARVYIMSADWNPCNEIQAIARSHRLGQTRSVKVKRLVLVDQKQEFSVIDNRIEKIQIQKRELMSGLLNEPELRDNGKRCKFNLDRGEYTFAITSSPCLPTRQTTQPSTAITQPSTAITQPSTAITQPSAATTQPSTAITQPSAATTQPSHRNYTTVRSNHTTKKMPRKAGKAGRKAPKKAPKARLSVLNSALINGCK